MLHRCKVQSTVTLSTPIAFANGLLPLSHSCIYCREPSLNNLGGSWRGVATPRVQSRRSWWGAMNRENESRDRRCGSRRAEQTYGLVLLEEIEQGA
jgi:hypothetical protein